MILEAFEETTLRTLEAFSEMPFVDNMMQNLIETGTPPTLDRLPRLVDTLHLANLDISQVANRKIGHLVNGKIPQMPDASQGFLHYTE